MEQRVKFMNMLNHAMSDPDFDEKVRYNPDRQNRRLASEALFSRAMRREREREIDLYKKYASDADFKKGLHDALIRIMEHTLESQGSGAGL